MKKNSMKNLLGTATLIFVSACIAFCQTGPREPVVVAKEFVDLLVKGDFAAAAKNFDETVSAALPPDKLREVWTALNAQAGAFQKQLGTQSGQYGALSVVLVTCQFQRAVIDVKVALDGQRRIAGLWFLPGKPPTPVSTPRYWRTETFQEEEFVVGSKPWALPGTLTTPKGDGPWPAVVLVHGSGPNDRDETVGANKPFKDLAWGLASQGIAVLRYEKRTKVYAAQIGSLLANLTVKEEVIDDVLTAVAQLRVTKRIAPDRIFVLGHSLGGMLIPRIAKLDTNITGFIVLAGATRPLEDMVLEQTRYLLTLNGNPDDAGKKRLEELSSLVAKIKQLKPSDSSSATRLLGAPPRYWLDLRGYEPAVVAKGVMRPMLVLQGGRDYQVTQVDFQGWQKTLATRKDVTFRLYPGLNHLFVAGKDKGTPAEYDQPGHVAEEVIKDIAEFIERTK
ncbi:MAG: alpha/beta fold hydrolase [Verrucomicrobiia bacterium]